jgi:hypothetical protein
MTVKGGYSLADFWYLSVYAVVIQAVISVFLLIIMWKKLGKKSDSTSGINMVTN